VRTGEPEGFVRAVRALADADLGARIVRRVRMRYAAGAEALHDRPAHVRAASGLAWLGDRLVVIQDDAGFVALVDPETGLAEAVTLPSGADGSRQFDDVRGNKAAKLDLEALARVPAAEGALFVAFGSGSMAPRETVVLLSFQRDDALAASRAGIAVRPARSFYGSLRRATGFAGSDMNVEGALYTQGIVRLFGRGNGAAVGAVQPLNASCDVDWAELRSHLDSPLTAASPPPQRIIQYDLGSVDGLPLGFTDATVAHESIVLYAAAAEASADATRDGEVRASALGVIRADAAGSARWTLLRDEGGRAFRGKIEGIAIDKSDERRLFAVVDCDDHAEPSELLDVALSGDWWS
jgi:hypothetical protein